MRFKRMWTHKHLFQRKMVLDIPKGVEDMDKTNKEEYEADLKKKARTTLTDQSVDRIKQTSQSVTPKMTIQDPVLTNQKVNVIIVKR